MVRTSAAVWVNFEKDREVVSGLRQLALRRHHDIDARTRRHRVTVSPDDLIMVSVRKPWSLITEGYAAAAVWRRAGEPRKICVC